jgi:hypothetical protein
MKNNLKVILAEINGSPELEVRQSIKLRKDCEAIGIKHPVNVNSVEDLIDVLGEEKGQSVVLFTNFPPNSSYPDSGKSMKMVDEEDHILRSWEADSYSISLKLFTALEKRYTFKAIHFITGAPPFFLTDENIESLFPGTPITINRKKDWIDSGKDYQELYRLFVEEKIKEALQ